MNESQFYIDVVKGLSASPKYLMSKYFYDAKGDELFERIMNAPEYYLTNCDLEIFQQKSDEISQTFKDELALDILELGAGNAVKSTYLLESFVRKQIPFTYYPIDISENVIENLETEMPQRIPGISMKGLAGEYFEACEKIYKTSNTRKLLLFLGSSIGNFEVEDAKEFLSHIYKLMNSGDRILIGFDLKKDPNQILAAYNDAGKVTRDFNLNLLSRINEELDANFDVDSFIHFPTYNPLTGACRSYLLSTKNSEVLIPGAAKIVFEAYEAIDMELSQKFSEAQILALASEIGFSHEKTIQDSQKWYCNVIWKK